MEKIKIALLIIIISMLTLVWAGPYLSFTVTMETKIVFSSILIFVLCWYFYKIDSRIPLYIGILLLLFSSIHVMDAGPASELANQFASYGFYFLILGLGINVYEYFNKRS